MKTELFNAKPANPFIKDTIIWRVMEGDWEDLTKEQIGEVLAASPETISEAIATIKKKTGYSVPYRKKGG